MGRSGEMTRFAIRLAVAACVLQLFASACGGGNSGQPASGGAAAPAGGTSAAKDDDKQWTLQNKNYASTRYSTRDSITGDNVKNLKVAWTFSTGVLRGHEGAP